MPGEQDLKRNPLASSQGNSQPSLSNLGKNDVPIPSSPKFTSSNLAQVVSSPQPEFGRPTALNTTSNLSKKPDISAGATRRNIAKNSDPNEHLFAKPRPKALEFYKPPGVANPLQQLGKLGSSQQPTQIRPSYPPPTNNYGQSQTKYTLNNPHSKLEQQSQPGSRYDNDVFIIPKPGNFPSQPFNRPQPPNFSSQMNTNPFYQTKSNFVDLSKPTEFKSASDDAFSDQHVFGNDRFGMADPHMYVDSEKANENIKALLEGALDDEDEKPRTRRKKKEFDTKLDNLTKKMQNVAVESEEKKYAKQLDEGDDEEDDGSREGLKVKLLPHQIEGVDWMRNKEMGTKKVKGILPKGGILADDMGLGKTIQSIALMLSNPKPSAAELERSKQKLDPKTDKTTLVVAPLALIKQWEGEINDRIEKEYALSVRVHHGPQRTKSYKELRKFDVVITTYQTLSSEHAEGTDSALFGVHWFRVILDEAHSIKNRNAKVTKAACAINSEFRWCLTGTPMQNNLDELQSLIHFLKIKPYDNLEVWREQITKPMNNGRGGLSIRRLRAFLSAFMKRRTKDVLKQDDAQKNETSEQSDKPAKGFRIVKRTIEKVEAEFSEKEREFYNGLEARTDRSLEMMMAGNKLSYANALVLLMRLRQACNHSKLLGTDLSKEQDSSAQTPSRKSSKANDIDEIANMLGGLSVETKRCDICQIELNNDSVKSGLLRCDECENDLRKQDLLSKTSKQRRKHTSRKDILHKDKPGNRRIILDSDDEDENHPKGNERLEDQVGDSSEYDIDSSCEEEPDLVSSTKIRELIKILQNDSQTHKYIVFSFFTSMLNLIEPFLRQSKIKYVRYDGAMRNDMREASLNSLRNDPSVRVLLCSLRAGSLGLNLTAASRVVILEPFWNPFVEEQAIDRVHRLNQTEDVVVHKLTVKDTVEARILELQEKKRELAKATIEGQQSTEAAKLSLQEMLKLFRHDSEKNAKLDMIGMKDRGGVWDRLASMEPDQEVRPIKSNRKEHPVYGRRW